MTDGLIQKVFKKYSTNWDTNYDVGISEFLMKELIEEIKKKQTRFGLLTSIPIKDLIGDSE